MVEFLGLENFLSGTMKPRNAAHTPPPGNFSSKTDYLNLIVKVQNSF